jgi:2-polyprenyl-3-methyl-5-hydroxy-6-metoxy-1,4-benzoquinol methylase
MKSKDLGLPIEYQMYPEYFDSPSDIYNTNEKNEEIEKLLNKYDVKTVLDMTCGTGAQVFYLARLGYKVVGSDFSPGLIKIAREKALEQDVAVEFIDGDMRDLQVEDQFDAVITIDNAIGHLVQDDFEIAIRNIYKNLNDGGLYIFDILNLEAMTDEVIKSDNERVSDKKIAMDGAVIYTKRYSTSIDRENGYSTACEEITICKDEKQTKIENKCTLKIYTTNQIRELLSRNGLKLLEQHKIDAYTFQKDDSGYSILTVARKK